MKQSCWIPSHETGFLMYPDPVYDLRLVDCGLASEVAQQLQETADDLPRLIAGGHVRSVMAQLPVRELSCLADCDDFRIIERLFQIYSHFANAYVWCDEKDPADHIPSGVAVPIVYLSKLVERPPILPYANTSLCNFERIDKDGGLTVDNLRCVQKLVDIPDESWFHLIHVEIEAHSSSLISACNDARIGIEEADEARVEQALARIPAVFDRMMKTFVRITEKCNTDVYYHTLRPYLFGFDGVVYEGVEEFGGKPQTFRGESGAQSSVIPAIKAYLGVEHAEGGMTEHLNIMKAYMPKPHREFLAGIDPRAVRNFVTKSKNSALTETYNDCLVKLVDFRSLHLRMAHAFIAQKVKDPRGTGGTDFMHWLTVLRDETAEQLIRNWHCGK